ncbi:hypothetical protein A33M_0789 [Rhodovulum sp. PH10]|nr:hypothetical protein A33M_0789 [Rhodovulum sp. PH10]
MLTSGLGDRSAESWSGSCRERRDTSRRGAPKSIRVFGRLFRPHGGVNAGAAVRTPSCPRARSAYLPVTRTGHSCLILGRLPFRRALLCSACGFRP